MDGKTSVKYLQNYIKSKDYQPDSVMDYFFKLTEEVGELSKAMRKNLRPAEDGIIKNTLDEELWDIIYYVLAIANCYDIDMETVIHLKEQINHEKYNSCIVFEQDR